MKNITYKKICCFLFLVLGISNAQSQLVTSNADDGSIGTLRIQIALANDGDNIIFAPGITNVVLALGQININKPLTITGDLLTNTVINAVNNSRIFNITDAEVMLNNLDLTNGTAADGGAIMLTAASLTINSSSITNCVANGTPGSGGAIYVGTDGDLTVSNTSITGNIANRAGGGIELAAGSSATLTNVNLSNNNAGVAPATAAPGNGGGLHITGAADATIMGGTVANNTAAAEGGGLWNGAGSMDIDGTQITENTASGDASDNGGGGIYNLSGMLSIINATVSNNNANGAAGSGGGILNDVGGSLSIENATVSNNIANRAGGGIEVNSGAAAVVELTNVTLNGNNALTAPGNGGGLHVTGAGIVNIDGGTVNTNSAGAEGGGLWNGSGTMTISGTTINGNTASGAGADQGGGGIYNFNGGTLTIDTVTISNNVANGALGSGGGILNDVGSQLSLTDVIITGNTAVRAGGGIEDNSGTSTILLNNVNLDTNNVTGPPGNGGGLHITGGGSATIIDGTVNGNISPLEGGGLWNGTGTMTINGTIIDGNMASGADAADGGAGIFNNGGTLAISNAQISHNMATGASGSGGGIMSMSGDITVDLSTIDTNSANRAGGGIELVAGTLTVTASEITNNDVDGVAGAPNPGNGGGLHVTGIATVNITNTTVAENDARREGGGLWNQTGSNMNITTSTIDSNTASGVDVVNGGGGIFNNGGVLVVMSSTLSSNAADGALGNGGALHVKSGSAELRTCTISGNTSLNDGGGIYSNGTLALNAVTIADNEATANGGGVATAATAVMATNLKNSLIATNSAATGKDISGNVESYMSLGYNLIGEDDSTGLTLAIGDAEGTNGFPINTFLGPLADNGGPTQTHAILTNSPAYNAGDPADLFNDQRDNTVFGGRRDIGAYEAQTVLAQNQFAAGSKMTVIYPNPAVNGSFRIMLAQNFGSEANVKMIEVASGKVVKEFAADNDMTVDVSGLSSGVYAVRIASKNATETHKLLIQ